MKINKPANVVAMLIPLDLIKENTNIRIEYNQNDIDSLAASIEQYGQLQPVGVKPADEEGFYELVFGYRRHRAMQQLAKQGKPFTQMKAVFANGNTLILQLIENIQRSDLSYEEKEKALTEMSKEMSQTEIATALNKSRQWVSDLLAGVKVRENAANTGVDTSEMATKALAAARSVPQESLAQVITEAKKNGGSVKATEQAVKNFVNATKAPPAVIEPTLKENPEDSYDFGSKRMVDLGEIIGEIANYRGGWNKFSNSLKGSNVQHTCNRIIEILIKRFCD